MQNERHDCTHYIETTTFNVLKGLRDEHDIHFNERLKKSFIGARGVSVKHQEVAQAYDGGITKNYSVKQAASVAVLLSARGIEALCSVINT